MIKRMMIGAASLALLGALPAAAQVRQPRPRRIEQAVPRGQRRAEQVAPQRGQLEREVRQRMFEVVRTRVGLNDDQMRRLQSVNERVEPQRRQLLQQERQTRTELRDLMLAPQPDQAKIDAGLKTLVQLQRRRLDLLESEQQEMSDFMTPLQRARFAALQEQMRRRLDQLRQQRQLRQQQDSTPLPDVPPA